MLRDSLGVGIAVGLSGVAFGSTAASAGLTTAQACALSLFTFTGASQFALVAAIAGGGNPLVGAVSAILLGGRNSLYGLRLAPMLGLSAGRRLAAAHWVIDETTAVTQAQPDRRSARLGFTATGATLFLLWNTTTLLGALGTAALGDPSRYGLDAAGPAVFLALVAPRIAQGRAERWTAGLAVLIALGATPLLPPGVPILLAVLAVAPAMILARKADRR